MLTKGLKRETIDEHIKFSGGQLVESRSKTALSIHAVSKIMRAIKPNLLQNGGDKQILCDLNLLEDDGTAVALINVHRRDDLKAASEPKAAATFAELLFVVDAFFLS